MSVHATDILRAAFGIFIVKALARRRPTVVGAIGVRRSELQRKLVGDDGNCVVVRATVPPHFAGLHLVCEASIAFAAGLDVL